MVFDVVESLSALRLVSQFSGRDGTIRQNALLEKETALDLALESNTPSTTLPSNSSSSSLDQNPKKDMWYIGVDDIED